MHFYSLKKNGVEDATNLGRLFLFFLNDLKKCNHLCAIDNFNWFYLFMIKLENEIFFEVNEEECFDKKKKTFYCVSYRL